MKTSLRDTSYQAYRNDVLPSIGEHQQKVLEIIRQEDYLSDKEIAQRLGWTINSVTGRRNELEQKGLIFDAGTKQDERTGRRVHIWTAVKKQQILFF